jgi:3-deoxy-D-manno-octulosonic-acid transferase
LLVLVPRHPQRFDAVNQLIQLAGLSVHRRSAVDASGADVDVWLGDSMGEMAAYVAMCDVAFIGGSLLPLGGQNLIEACAQGKPVVMGPSIYNFADAARLAMEAGAMRQAEDADAVMRAVTELFQDEEMRESASRAAHAFARAHAGATDKTMGLIAPLLAAIN